MRHSLQVVPDKSQRPLNREERIQGHVAAIRDANEAIKTHTQQLEKLLKAPESAGSPQDAA